MWFMSNCLRNSRFEVEPIDKNVRRWKDLRIEPLKRESCLPRQDLVADVTQIDGCEFSVATRSLINKIVLMIKKAMQNLNLAYSRELLAVLRQDSNQELEQDL